MALFALEPPQMDPAFQGQTGENDQNEPAERTVQGRPGERAQDREGNESFVEAGTGGGIGRRHLLRWYAGRAYFGIL